jgi:hypothetical protein
MHLSRERAAGGLPRWQRRRHGWQWLGSAGTHPGRDVCARGRTARDTLPDRAHRSGDPWSARHWTGARSRETTSTPVAKKFIAGGAWDPAAVAPKRNVYFGIGTMLQYSDAVSRPSKRLYVDSAVALDASSGKLRRDFQPVPEDFYDWSPCAAARAGCRVVAKYVATNTDE